MVRSVIVCALLVVLSDDEFKFSQAWISISLLLYIIALGIAHGVMIPSGRKMFAVGARMGSAQGRPADSDIAEAEGLQKKLATGGMTLNLLVVLLLVMMIWKPGL